MFKHWMKAFRPRQDQPEEADIARDFSKVESELAQALAGVSALHGAMAPMLRVVRRMQMGYGYPAADIAYDLCMEEKAVRSILRALQAQGLAMLHPFHSEDDNLIRGSGYSLTAAGERLRMMLPDEAASIAHRVGVEPARAVA